MVLESVLESVLEWLVVPSDLSVEVGPPYSIGLGLAVEVQDLLNLKIFLTFEVGNEGLAGWLLREINVMMAELGRVKYFFRLLLGFSELVFYKGSLVFPQMVLLRRLPFESVLELVVEACLD